MTRSLLVAFSLLATILTSQIAAPLRCQEEQPSPHGQQPAAGATTESNDVTYGKHKVAAALFQKTWDPNDPRPTCKVFHQVFAPDGTLLTKALGGTFEHHRGLFVGWNRTKYQGKLYYFWHLNKGESQRCQGQVPPSSLDMGKQAQVLSIGWFAPDEQLVIEELRGLEVVDFQDDAYTLHMRVQCSTKQHDVELAGDPQHAGQQFRALQQFAEEKATPVAYLRPDGNKDHGNDVLTKCDLIAGILELPQATYTVLRIEGPNNPGETTWSTRPYGRFGATRTVTVQKDKPMRIDQFYVVANGKRDAAWCQAQATKWRALHAKQTKPHQAGSSRG